MVATAARAGQHGNIANIITVVRILLAPVFIWLLLADDGADGPLRSRRPVLFVVAILTDSLDGMLARGRNLVTDFGKILDPIADKVLIGGALVVRCRSSASCPGGSPRSSSCARSASPSSASSSCSDRVIPASRGGKLKTLLQAVAISLALFPF